MAKKNELKSGGNETVQVPDEFKSTAWVKYYPMGRDLDYTVITADAVRLVECGKLLQGYLCEDKKSKSVFKDSFL